MSTETQTAETIAVVFDGPPANESGRFIEVEDSSGASIAAGEWHDRGDGTWELRLGRAQKRTVLGFVVVGRDGGMVTGASYTNREAAQAYADRWSADAEANRVDWDYRVAEIVESQP